MYQEFGFYLEKLISLTKKGMAGTEEINKMMENFRKNPPQTLAGSRVVKVADYQNLIEKDLISGEEKALHFEKSNVLQFFTEDGSKISARPSGTEPKIKFYFSVKGYLDSKENFDLVEQSLKDKIDFIIKDLAL
jgi:phosphoglucomutase